MADRELEYVDFDAECVAETGKAIGVYIDGAGELVWIPKSLVSATSEVQKKGDVGTLGIPQWLAEQKGLA